MVLETGQISPFIGSVSSKLKSLEDLILFFGAEINSSNVGSLESDLYSELKTSLTVLHR